MASNTGWRSVGELEMTRRISAGRRLLLQRLGQLAVARLQLGEQADVLDGDDRLVGEDLQQGDLLVGEGLDFLTAHGERADGVPLSKHGHGDEGAVSNLLGRRPEVGKLVGLRGQDVVNVHRRAVDDGAPGGEGPLEDPRLGNAVDDGPVVGRDPDDPFLQQLDRGVIRSAHQRRALCDGVQHRLEVRGRARDDSQDLGGGGLLLERLGQLAVARLQLGEQADVLDRDDRLVGEGLEQRDLLVGERANLLATDEDGADGRAVAEQRHGEDGPVAGTRLEGSADREIRLVDGEHIVDVDGSPLRDRTPAR